MAAVNTYFSAELVGAGLGNARLQNVTLANTVNLRAMFGGGLNAGKRGRLLSIGDSYPTGTGASGSGNSRTRGYMYLLAGMLNKFFPTFTNGASLGDVGYTTAANAMTFDPRVSFTGTATVASSATFGGRSLGKLTSGSAGASKIAVNFGTTFDRICLLYADNATASTNFTVSLDGGTTTLQTITYSNTNALIATTMNCSVGSNTVTLSNGAGNGYPAYMYVYTSTVPGIDLINGAYSGAQLYDMINGAGSFPFAAYTAVPLLLDSNGYNVTIVDGVFNDVNNGTRTAAQGYTDMMAAIAIAKAKGDVIVTTYANISTAVQSQPVLDSINNAIIQAAMDSGVPYFDMRQIFPDFTTANNMGLMFDNIHLGPAGQGMVARALFNALTQI